MSLYKEAEQFLVSVGSKPNGGSLQNRIFEASNNKKIKSNPKQVYALVVSTLKFKPYIQEIVKKSKILKVETKLNERLCLLLVHDLLFTKNGRIQCGKHPLKDSVLRHKTRLNAEFIKLKLKHKVTDINELEVGDIVDKDQTPVRWFRCNTIKTTAESLLKEFQHLTRVYSIEELKLGTIYHDIYIPNLFGVFPREKITNTDAYLKGRLIIQDRASCFPAYILNPKPNIDKVIDACAAPGNKTTHLASILQNVPGSIIAFEKDVKRAKILKTMCDKAGGLKCISVQQGDFTSVNPLDYPEITGFVVDPSCSGSGIFGRALYDDDSEQDLKEEIDENRLIKLSGFQFKIVKHALSFPNARKLVYSTCSIHAQENERVVIDLLRDPDVIKNGWTLSTREDVIPTWERRGFVEEFSSFGEDAVKLAGGCIRSLPKIDGGIGFFAACFEKK